jgi:hypothetical protein
MLVRMHQYNQNKIDGFETWPEFKKRMHSYVPVGVIFIELKDCSHYATGIESRSLLHDETDFVSGSDYRVSQILLCIRYDGTWAEISSGE